MAKFDTFTYTIRNAATGEVTTQTGRVKVGTGPAPAVSTPSAQEDEIAMQSRAELEIAAMWSSSGPTRARLLQR